MKRYKGDPRKITARFNSACSTCNCRIAKGVDAYYWPNGKKVLCSKCGEPEYRLFLSMAADEAAWNGQGNPW